MVWGPQEKGNIAIYQVIYFKLSFFGLKCLDHEDNDQRKEQCFKELSAIAIKDKNEKVFSALSRDEQALQKTLRRNETKDDSLAASRVRMPRSIQHNSNYALSGAGGHGHQR